MIAVVESWHKNWVDINKYIITTSLAAIGVSASIIGAFGAKEALWTYLRRDAITQGWVSFGLSAGLAIISIMLCLLALNKGYRLVSSKSRHAELPSDIKLLTRVVFGFTILSFCLLVVGVISLVSFGSMQIG